MISHIYVTLPQACYVSPIIPDENHSLVDQGRAGQKGHAVTLIVERDAHALRGIVEAGMGWCEGQDPEKLRGRLMVEMVDGLSLMLFFQM